MLGNETRRLGGRMPVSTPQDLVFIGGRHLVVALDRYDGSEVWRWKASSGKGFWGSLSSPSFVSIALDGDRLIVASPKQIWCLDPLTGEEVWRSEGVSFGLGAYPVIAGTSASGQTAASAAGAAAAQAAAAAAAGGVAAATAASS
jgi:outer membrane protein assembly factor BamB